LVPAPASERHKIDHPGKNTANVMRLLYNKQPRTKPFTQGRDGKRNIIDAIAFIHKHNARELVTVGLPPNSFGLRFHASAGINDYDGSV